MRLDSFSLLESQQIRVLLEPSLFSGHSGYLPQSKNTHISLIEDSKLLLGVCVGVSWDANIRLQ